MGLFDKLKQGLKKTNRLLHTDIRDLFKAQGRLVDESFLTELFERLVKTDMGVEAAQEIVDEVGETFRARVVHEAEVVDKIKQKLKTLLAQPAEPIRFAACGPDRHHGGRRERLRQDHDHRQAGADVSGRREEGRSSARPTRSARRPSSS